MKKSKPKQSPTAKQLQAMLDILQTRLNKICDMMEKDCLCKGYIKEIKRIARGESKTF